MFGEISMYGTKIVKVDNKCRFYLPSFTHAEQGENLVLSKIDDDISIYSLEYIDSVVKTLEEKIVYEKDIKTKEHLKDTLDEFLCSLINTSKVDNYKRIMVSNVLEKNTMYKVIGARTYIKVKSL